MGNKTSHLKEILENAPKPIPKKTFDQLSQNLPKSICFIEGKNEIGTGAIFKIEEIPKFYCIITCFHVLSPKYLFEAIIKFEGFDRFKLKPEWIGRMSFRPKREGDYLAIELKPAGVKFLEDKGLIFLKVNSAKFDDQIVVIGYANASLENPEMSVGVGAIQTTDELISKGFTLEYYAATGLGTSGSPLVLWSGEAIGIHRSREDERAASKAFLNAAGSRRFATSLAEIKKNILLDIGKIN